VLIQVIHGPNFNLLGLREPGVYGASSLADLDQQLTALAQELGIDLRSFQSNHEGEIVVKIHECIGTEVGGILINAAAYTHTSVAIRDALKAVALPFVEVHMTNVYARESFRHKSMISDIADGIVIGLGVDSYCLGLRGLANKLKKK
jgi:3-dehydroquinate dehydratase II